MRHLLLTTVLLSLSLLVACNEEEKTSGLSKKSEVKEEVSSGQVAITYLNRHTDELDTYEFSKTTKIALNKTTIQDWPFQASLDAELISEDFAAYYGISLVLKTDDLDMKLHFKSKERMATVKKTYACHPSKKISVYKGSSYELEELNDCTFTSSIILAGEDLFLEPLSCTLEVKHANTRESQNSIDPTNGGFPIIQLGKITDEDHNKGSELSFKAQCFTFDSPEIILLKVDFDASATYEHIPPQHSSKTFRR